MEKVTGLVEILRGATTREEAYSYIEGNKLTVAALKKAAKECEIYINAGYNKERIVEKIVEGTIGARIKMRILMGN